MSEEREAYGAEMAWDSEIPVDEGRGDFVTLPAGTECDFEVKKFDRDRSKAGDPQAKLELICTAEDGRRAYVHENLTLSPSAMFRVRKFGVAIGHLTQNAPGRIAWDRLLGVTGRCRLVVEPWTRRDGSEAESNKVKEWLPPAENDAAGEEVSFG
jgi:hypothetical protein